jgi:transcriptional regulator with XRE-family HTH domain
MKRRTATRTDTELANALGVHQSTISTWRRRSAVPEAALLQAERAGLDRQIDAVQKPVAALALAMRAAEALYQRQVDRGSPANRWLAYSAVATVLKEVIGATDESLRQISAQSGRWSLDLGSELIEDEAYLSKLVDWIDEKWGGLTGADADWRQTPDVS